MAGKLPVEFVELEAKGSIKRGGFDFYFVPKDGKLESENVRRLLAYIGNRAKAAGYEENDDVTIYIRIKRK